MSCDQISVASHAEPRRLVVTTVLDQNYTELAVALVYRRVQTIAGGRQKVREGTSMLDNQVDHEIRYNSIQKSSVSH